MTRAAYFLTNTGKRYVGELERAKVWVESEVKRGLQSNMGLLIVEAWPQEFVDFLVDLQRRCPASPRVQWACVPNPSPSFLLH